MYPPKELEKIFGLEYEQLRSRARTLGLKSKKVIKRELINHKFFSHMTILSSYWAGFLTADGYLQQDKLWIGLSEKDKLHLKRFASLLGVSDSIRTYNSKAGMNGVTQGKEYVRVVLKISSIELMNDLHKNFNVVTKKSLRIPSSNVCGRYGEAFLAGLIDGDGFIGPDRIGNIRFGYVGSKRLCRWGAIYINQLLIQLGRRPTIVERETRKGLWEMRCTGKNAQIVLNRLKMTCGEYVLLRKWKMLEKFNREKEWMKGDRTLAREGVG